MQMHSPDKYPYDPGLLFPARLQFPYSALLHFLQTAIHAHHIQRKGMTFHTLSAL
jgi:hypothetical protein